MHAWSVHKNKHAFTLIEQLVVVAVIAILAAMLFPVVTRGTLRARVARVHSDLRQIAIAIEMYKDDCGGLPPVRSCCTGSARWDYYELPHELVSMHYLGTYRMYDPFNRTRGEDGQLGRTYKYLAINWGYSGGHKGYFAMWIPRDYPACNEDCILYYNYAGRIYACDKGKTYPKEPPIMWAVWSVGPGGDPGLEETGNRMLPVPKSQWYPFNNSGVIVRFSDGRKSP
jgi:prepilin-type N-terminal cleavage/methylation domain-containing protein